VVWHAAGDTLTWLGSTYEDWEGLWVHYAFVKNANVGSMRIYRNGQKVAERTSTYNSMSSIRDTTFYIGAKRSHSNDYIGDMDDFRVYDYALSNEEVAYLGDEGWLVVPLDSRANLYDDDVMDFRDFVILASQWLESCP